MESSQVLRRPFPCDYYVRLGVRTQSTTRVVTVLRLAHCASRPIRSENDRGEAALGQCACPWGLHGERGVVLEHAPGDQVVEEHADGGHVLLEGGGRQAVGLGGFEVVAHIQRTNVCTRWAHNSAIDPAAS